MPNFIYSLSDLFIIHSGEAFDAKQVVRTSRAKSGDTKGDGGGRPSVAFEEDVCLLFGDIVYEKRKGGSV